MSRHRQKSTLIIFSFTHSLFPSLSLFHFASSIVKQWIFSIFHSVIFFRYLVLYIPFYINHTFNHFEIINNYTWITFLKKRKNSKQPKREKRNSKKRHQFLQFQSNVCFISNEVDQFIWMTVILFGVNGFVWLLPTSAFWIPLYSYDLDVDWLHQDDDFEFSFKIPISIPYPNQKR